VEQVAYALKDVQHCCTGRGINMPRHMKALKLKEISYIHARLSGRGDEARADRADRPQHAGVVIAPRDPWYEKMFSQIEQAKARGGGVALATDGDERIANVADYVLWCRRRPGCSAGNYGDPAATAGYHIAALRGWTWTSRQPGQERDGGVGPFRLPVHIAELMPQVARWMASR